MTIKIVRNADGNCITFEGSTNPVYFNACLSGEVDPTYSDRVNVINDIATAQSAETVYEFYQIDYTEFRDADNNPFASATDAAAYVTAQGNVISVAGATYLGTWDASTNTPALTGATHGGEEGDFYYVSADGTTALDVETSWRRGDKVIWNGSTWQKLQATSVIDGSTYSTLLNTQTSVYADGEGATADESGIPGWYYSNTENNKINWYVYGDTPAIRNELGDLALFYAVITPKNTTSEPYFSIYTKVEGDGEDQSWYRSRVTYYDQTNLQTMVAGTQYLVHGATINGALLDSVDTLLPRISLGKDAATTAGPQGASEELFLMALSTSSNYPAGTNEFTVEKIGYVIGDHQQEFSLSAPPTTGASTFDVTPSDLDFELEATGTTVLANDGEQYSVNSIRALDNGDGTIDIVALPGQQVVYDNLDYSSLTIAGSAAGTNVGNSVNALNALFANLPLGVGGTYQPTYPVLDATNVTVTTRGTVTPTTTKSDGTTVHLYGQSGTGTNADIIYSTETIDAAGEFYTVKIAGGGRFLIGLGSEADGDRTELASPGTNAAAGLKWCQAFYDYGSYSAPWTIYGSSPGLSYGPGWSFSSTDVQMRYNTGVQNELDNGNGAPGLRDGALFKIGIDQNGYISCWYYDEGRSNTFILTSRSTTVTPAGDYFLVVKLWDSNNVMVELPQRSAVDDAAPVLNYRFIESPDGAHTYPLFASADEAAYVDEQFTGTTGEVTAHVFIDEPTASVWYKPVHVGNEGVQFPPSNTDTITYSEIPTLDDGLFGPALLNIPDYTFTENQTVNIQIHPQDTEPVNITPEFTLALSNLGLNYNNGFITGTTSYVIRDTPAVITVSRSNSYSTTTETFGITVTDNASLSDIAGFTETQGNFVQPNRVILNYDALLQYDTQINPGEELTYSYSQIPPTIGILSSTGESNLAAFDPATDTLGTVSGVNNFAETANWDLRYVSFGGYIGANSTKHALVGWDDNTIQPGNEGTLANVEFKLEYGVDGYFRLYVGGVLKLTSANTFSGAQTLTFAGFDDQQQSDVYVPANWAIVSSVDTDTPPAGFVDPVESGEMSTNTLFGPSAHGAVFLTETLKVNHRYIVPQTWIEANVLPYITGAEAGTGGEQFFFGVPKDGTNWDVVGLTTDWHAVFRLEGATNGHYSRLYTDGNSSVSDSTVTVNSATDAYYDYAIEWDGADLHIIACNIGDINTQPGINNGGTFSRVLTISGFAGAHGKTNTELNLVIAVNSNGSVNLTTSGLQQIRIPFGDNVILHGESSSGNGQFGQVESTYFDLGGQHAPGALTFAHPTINAGYTYTYVYHPSMESDDYMEFRLASDSTTVYTTGVTAFDYTTNGDPSYSGLQGYKGITFAVPTDAPPLRVYHYNSYQSGYFDAGREVPISGSTYVTPVTGVSIEGPVANFTGNVINSGSNGWISLNETLSAGERLVLDSAFLEDLNAALPDYSIFWVGLKSDTWANTDFPLSSFKGGCALRFYNTSDTGNSEPGLRILGYANNSLTSQLYTASLAQASAFLEITNSGNNIRVGYEATSDTSLNAASTPYSDWEISAKIQTGDQGYGITSAEVGIYWVAIGGNDTGFDISTVDWTGLSEVSVPTVAATLATSWTKALDFSGSSERTQQVSSSSTRAPIKMGGVNNNVAQPAITGYTSNDANARPWATAIVFSSDNNSSNQHIWNLGEGAGSTDDNIYLRVDSVRNLYFGWGRTGEINECNLGTLASGSGNWYGIYIAHTGERLGSGHLAHQIARCFDIRGINLSTGTVGSQISTSGNWGSFGGRMNREFTGDITVGGRGANRNFHGKVAGMVVTTLRRNVPMPTDAEISMMVRDPRQWLLDYKIGNDFRLPWQGTDAGFNFSMFDGSSSYATQVWLMGDGPSDAYAQIRNHVFYTSQNDTPMNMISMVSNDIETVNITGLS
ncbi:hypothetical protein SCRES2_gp98 [Synechococcus phage S-CRES2]|nr:hypothetical protein SCRES2_gp98 [Synechococcus phage S-CRES2]